MVGTARRDIADQLAQYPRPDVINEIIELERPATKQFSVLKIAPTSFFADYGCHVRILEETLALQQLGSRVVVCTYKSGRDIPGVEIKRGLGVPWANGIKVGSSKRKIVLDAWLSLRSLSASFGFKPDILHAHLHEGALIGYPLSKLHKAPLIFDFQGSLTCEMLDHNFLRRDSILYGPLRKLENLINDRAQAILTSSHNAADVLIRDFGCDHRKVFPVPDCVNPDRFGPRWEVGEEQKQALRAELGIPEGRKIVVYLGLLAEYQGSTHLLKAAEVICRHRSDVHFLLMGFPGQERYQDLAIGLGIQDHVTLPGRIPYELAPLYLSLGDIAVSPKISETEGNGKLLNYMSVGLPTVTFKTPVSREILGDLGAYADLGDFWDLADVLESLIEDKDRAEGIGRELRERVLRHFVWENAGRKILEIYEDAGR
jgi:glycosyltransferase involved in cell wall biosynthesis